jgi:hypothetical protein
MKKITTLLTLLVFSSIFSQIPYFVPTNGLVGYWPFNGNANDESGNAHNGNITGATLTTDRYGNANSAYLYSGNNNYITIPNTSTLSGFADITISGWVNISQFPSSLSNGLSGLVTKWYGSGNCGGVTDNYACYIRTNNQFVGATNQYRVYPNDLQTPNNLTTSNWYHFVMIHNSVTGGSFYINGILISTYTTVGALCSSTNSLYFGCDNVLGTLNRFFNGKLDDIGIWNRTLTQNEITSLYLADTTCQSLVINTGILSFNPVTYNNTVTIYPNPANDHITIDCGNLANVTGYQIKIVNTLGQEVFSGAMNTQQYVVPLNTWSGTGVYFVKIYDASNNLLNTKKIILQ